MSPGQELREAHLGVLRGRLPIAVPPWSLNGAGATTPAPPVEGTGPRRPSPPIPARPAQLPADVSAFTGREAELRALDALLPPVLAAGAEAGEGSGGPGATPLDGAAAVSPGSGTQRSAPPVAVVTGMAGMGKTALALHWAHRARRRFPDGQLFADLRGNGDDPARPIDVLAGFLGALGVPPESVPADEDEASALLRSCLDGKLVLIVLDNAATAQQARPLLAASPGSATLITARDRLTSLAARNGAALLTLEALPQPASAALLAQVIGQHRANAEPAEVAALSELCAHLPLALRIAAANLTTRPTWRLAEYVTKLAASDRLTTLSVEGDPQTAVRAAFESSCDALEPTDRRLFSLAGIAPGRDLAVDSAAVLAGIAQAQAERSLERLAARNLVVEHASGRYKFHDLLRLYAGDLAEAEQPVAERDAALERLAAHVRRRLEHVADLVFPHLLRLPRLDGEPKQGPDTALEPTRGASGAGAGVAFPDAAAAIAWLEAERANLVDLVGRLVDDGSYHLALHIADHLCSHFILRLEVVDFEVVITAAQRAATAVENPAALAAVALWRGHMHGGRSRFADSARDFAESAALASRSGWADCEAVALNNLAHSRWMSGQIEDAIAGWREALELNRRSGRTVGEAVTLANLGAAHLQLARLGPGNRDDDPAGEAMRLLEEALTLHRKVRDRRNEAATVRLIAEAHRDRGDQRRALDLVREALRLAAETGDPRGEVQARSTLATVLVRSGDTESGLDEHRRTLHLARDLGNLQTEAAILLELAGTHLQLGQPEDAMLAVRDVESLVALTSVPMLERQIRWVRRRIADTAVA
jgi:tetratricopeptide (TPR) repeat protein